MSWTNWGFDGTINEAQWSQMAGLLGNGYVAAGNGDCLVTAVGGARSVSVAAGTLYGDGVVSVNSGAETVAMTTPVNGQWYVIALRRTWATNTAALVAIAGATTSTTTPTAPPTSFPTLNTNAGVLTDQPIAWAWCNSANTTVVVYDIRLKAVKSLPPVVANQNERDAKFMTPTQGLQVWRDDLGAVETYFGLYNASTNPGGRDAAGWFTTDRQSGLVPVKPTSVTINSGTATQNSLGSITVSGVGNLKLSGIFTSQFKNYVLIGNIFTTSTNNTIFGAWLNGTTPSFSGYFNVGDYRSVAAGMGDWSSYNNDSQFAICNPEPGYNSGAGNIKADIFQPFTTEATMLNSTTYTTKSGGGFALFRTASAHSNVSRDGINIFVSSGTFTGTFTVYGVNN